MARSLGKADELADAATAAIGDCDDAHRGEHIVGLDKPDAVAPLRAPCVYSTGTSFGWRLFGLGSGFTGEASA
jgi:hypothetical protein